MPFFILITDLIFWFYTIGFNLYVLNGQYKNLRLGFEFAMPLYQKPNGIQLQQREQVIVGLKYAL